MSCSSRVGKLVDRAFVRELSSGQRGRLREHLVGCSTCRDRWERLAIIDRRLGGPRLGEQTLEDVGRVVASGSGPRRRRLAWVGAAAAAAGIALAIVFLRPAPERSTFTARGTPSTGRTPGVRAFCVAGEGDHVRSEVRLVSVGSVPELRCSIDDDLQLAYTSPDRKGLTMTAFARMDSSLVQYVPSEGSAAMPVLADRIDELIPWSTHLAAEHRPGRYDLVVRFIEGETVTELHATLDIVRGGTDAP